MLALMELFPNMMPLLDMKKMTMMFILNIRPILKLKELNHKLLLCKLFIETKITNLVSLLKKIWEIMPPSRM